MGREPVFLFGSRPPGAAFRLFIANLHIGRFRDSQLTHWPGRSLNHPISPVKVSQKESGVKGQGQLRTQRSTVLKKMPTQGPLECPAVLGILEVPWAPMAIRKAPVHSNSQSDSRHLSCEGTIAPGPGCSPDCVARRTSLALPVRSSQVARQRRRQQHWRRWRGPELSEKLLGRKIPCFEHFQFTGGEALARLLTHREAGGRKAGELVL